MTAPTTDSFGARDARACAEAFEPTAAPEHVSGVRRAACADVSPTALPLRGVLKHTRDCWRTVWASPMAAAWLEAVVPARARLASLIDRVNRGDFTASLLAEIRQMEDRFGLSPIARRRLQWEVDQPSHADAAPAGR